MAARKKKAATKSFRAMVAIRVMKEDAARLDALAERLPIASRHAIARECLRLGMAILEKDPTQLVKSATTTSETPARRR